MGGSTTPTKLAQPQTLGLAQEVEETPEKLAHEPEDKLERNLVIVSMSDQ